MARNSRQCLPRCFNTQPPEGGWHAEALHQHDNRKFQHTAARRRLAAQTAPHYPSYHVSTHSRPKAAGNDSTYAYMIGAVSTHSRPKAAGLLR